MEKARPDSYADVLGQVPERLADQNTGPKLGHWGWVVPFHV